MTKLNNIYALTLCLLLVATVGDGMANDITFLGPHPENANKSLGMLPSLATEFNPTRKEKYAINFAVQELAKIDLKVYSSDGDVIRSLVEDQAFETGDHTIMWDGLDDDELTVPDEVYIPVIQYTSENSVLVDDSRRYSGGEIIPNIEWNLSGNTEISFDLQYPSRVLVRTGITDGPMMRALAHWDPVSPGKSVIRWDGYDKDGVELFAGRDDIWFVVMAYRIPEYSVITTGNSTTTYQEYRKSKGWKTPRPKLSEIQLQRNGVRLEQDYFLPRAYSPEVILDFVEGTKPSRVGIPIVEDTAQFRIDVPKRDRWILDTTFYETSFYIDYEFQSEEEQGFVPLIWDYDASALVPGRHIATVQLFGFGGFISSDTVEFLVAP